MSTIVEVSLKMLCPSCEAKLIFGKESALSVQKCSECDLYFTVPEPFGGFLLTDILANDECSETCHAQRTSDGASVVIRRLIKKYTENAPLKKVFLEEVDRLEHLQEENIVKAVDSGEIGGQAYVVYEHFGVMSLKRRLKKNPPSLIEGCYIALDILSSMEGCFSHSLVHGNLKPSNLRYDEHDNLRFFDYGLTMTLVKELMSERITLDLYNNAHYMAPETIARGELTPVSDIYSLGAIFYEIFTGQKTFGEMSDRGVMHIKLEQLPEPMNHMKPGIPPVLNALVMSMLSIKEDKRPQFIDQIIEGLQKTIEELEKKDKEKAMMDSTHISDVGYTESSIDVASIPQSISEGKAERENVKESQLVSILILTGAVLFLVALYFGLN